MRWYKRKIHTYSDFICFQNMKLTQKKEPHTVGHSVVRLYKQNNSHIGVFWSVNVTTVFIHRPITDDTDSVGEESEYGTKCIRIHLGRWVPVCISRENFSQNGKTVVSPSENAVGKSPNTTALCQHNRGKGNSIEAIRENFCHYFENTRTSIDQSEKRKLAGKLSGDGVSLKAAVSLAVNVLLQVFDCCTHGHDNAVADIQHDNIACSFYCLTPSSAVQLPRVVFCFEVRRL